MQMLYIQLIHVSMPWDSSTGHYSTNELSCMELEGLQNVFDRISLNLIVCRYTKPYHLFLCL